MEVTVVLLKYWTSDSELAGVLLREVRRATLCQLSLTLGLHACQSLLMIFTPVDAHRQ